MKSRNKTIRLTESNLSKRKYRSRESQIIKENCNRVIREKKTITYNQLFDVISGTANDLYLKGHSRRRITEGILDSIGDFFGKAPSGFVQTLKEKAFRWLLPKLGIKGKILDFLVISLSNMDIADYKIFLSPLDNCEKIADHLVDGFLEWLATEGLKKFDMGGGMFSDTIRNALADMVTDEGFVQNLQDKLNPVICSKIRSVFGGGDGEEDYQEDILGTVKSSLGLG